MSRLYLKKGGKSERILSLRTNVFVPMHFAQKIQCFLFSAAGLERRSLECFVGYGGEFILCGVS